MVSVKEMLEKHKEFDTMMSDFQGKWSEVAEYIFEERVKMGQLKNDWGHYYFSSLQLVNGMCRVDWVRGGSSFDNEPDEIEFHIFSDDTFDAEEYLAPYRLEYENSKEYSRLAAIKRKSDRIEELEKELESLRG